MQPEEIINKFIFEIYEDWVSRGSIEGKEIQFLSRETPYNSSLIKKIRTEFTANGQSLAVLSKTKIETGLLKLEFTYVIRGILHVIIFKSKNITKNYE